MDPTATRILSAAKAASAMDEPTVRLEISGVPVTVHAASKPSAAECAACRANLRLLSVLLPQVKSIGRN